jgi:hypothetical protein
MTYVDYVALPAASAAVAAETEPPTIKSAGRLPAYEAGGPAILLAALILGLLAVGALVQAVMTSEGRRLPGAICNVAAGVAALGLTVGSSVAFYSRDPWRELFGSIGEVSFVWLLLAVLAFSAGSLVKPPLRR